MNHWGHLHRRRAYEAARDAAIAWTIRTALTLGVVVGIAAGLTAIGALPLTLTVQGG